MDIKYVPQECIKENPQGMRYCQFTAIDEYSRECVMSIIDEKSVTNTGEFLVTLEACMGFKVITVQTYNGR